MKKPILYQYKKLKTFEQFVNDLNESQVISKTYGGYDDKEFLKIAWKMTIDELEKLLDKSESDLKWLKANSRGTLGLFNKKDAEWVESRINFIEQIIDSKQDKPDFIPDNYK